MSLNTQLTQAARNVDMMAFASLPIAPLELTDSQVEQLASIEPDVLARLAFQGAIDAPPSLHEVQGHGYQYMIAMPADVDDREDNAHRRILACFDADLSRWMILTQAAATRYLNDPSCVPELGFEDIVSVHKNAEQCRTVLLQMAGPSVLERVERAAFEFSQSAALSAVAAMSLALWSKRTRDGMEQADIQADALMDQYQAERLKLSNE